jgi:hypothetical protein
MTFSKLFAIASLSALLTGCAASSRQADDPAATIAQAPAPEVLQRSHYARDPSGSLSEAELQEILSKPIDLQFPARVGVVPLAEPFDPALSVSVATRGTAARHLSRALSSADQFSHVSDISTDLPKPGGIEGLRVLAARYRLRYLLLYSERFEDDTHVNGWAWLYPTVIGMFVAPGVTVQSQGLAQVDLLDVRTGTILFTVVQPLEVSSNQLMVGAARAHREKQGEAAALGAAQLAKRVAQQADLLVAFAERAQSGRLATRTRLLPAPIASDPPVLSRQPSEDGVVREQAAPAP